jgi:hypothetical protein
MLRFVQRDHLPRFQWSQLFYHQPGACRSTLRRCEPTRTSNGYYEMRRSASRQFCDMRMLHWPACPVGTLLCPKHASDHESLLRNESTANTMLATAMRRIIPRMMYSTVVRGMTISPSVIIIERPGAFFWGCNGIQSANAGFCRSRRHPGRRERTSCGGTAASESTVD